MKSDLWKFVAGGGFPNPGVPEDCLVEDLPSFLDLVGQLRMHWDFAPNENQTPWYRGQQRKHWRLEPNLVRIGCTDRESEDEIREEFAIRAPGLSHFEPMPDNDWDLYFLMQHYGAPTRLLDWTESPIIALYFAVRDNPGYYDSAVWVLDPYELNRRTIAKGEIISPSAVGSNKRDRERVAAWLPPRWSKKELPGNPLAIFPTHIARRISSQRSCFTIHGSQNDGFTAFRKGKTPPLLKIVVPGHAVKDMRLSLQHYGVDDTTIFPDLEGLGRALITAYRDVRPDSPHRGVFVRMKPSLARDGGVGVFAIKKIRKDTRIFADENEEVFWAHESEIPQSGPARKLYDDFSIIKDHRYGCPVSFNRLTPAWFLTNSDKSPNLRCDDNYDFYALRDIASGEELTVTYSTYSDEPRRALRKKKTRQRKNSSAR
jgi:hypothetical protein